MNSKRIPIILIAITFFIAAICSCYFLFTIRKVNIDFSVSENIDAVSVQTKFNGFIGESILFFDENQVYSTVKEYPNCKIEYVKKKSPNVLSIKITERLAVYQFIYQSETYLLDKEGVAISKGQHNIIARDLIELDLQGVEVVGEIALGEKLFVSQYKLFKAMLEMCDAIDLTDNIKKATVVYKDAGETRNVVFSTYTGVDITVTKADISSKEKIEKAVESYDGCTTDYIKSFNQILVVLLDTGEISVTWTKN